MKYLAVERENYAVLGKGTVCSKQKSDVSNDVTSDLATMRCMSDILFAAKNNQVCREEKARSKAMLSTSLPLLPFIR